MDSATAASLESLHPDAFGWSLHCCGGDAGRAEDVLQNAYLKVAAERVRFDGRSAFKTWWFGVIRLTALEEHRRARFRESLLGKLLASFTEEHHPSLSRQLERDEQAAQLRAALEKLPARQAETLHLVFLPGFDAQRGLAGHAGKPRLRAPALRTRQSTPPRAAANLPRP